MKVRKSTSFVYRIERRQSLWIPIALNQGSAS